LILKEDVFYSKKLIIGVTAEGSVNLLIGQLSYFKNLGYQTYLLAPYSERSAKFCRDEGCVHLVINIERGISLWKDSKTLFQIIKIFRKVKPDIVNLGTPKVSLLGMIAAFLFRVPKRIYTCRGFRFEHEKGLKRRVLITMERITSLFAQQVICISNSVKELGLKNKIFPENKVIVIRRGSSNGVNLSLFNPREPRYHEVKLRLQAKFQLSDKFVFGFLGRIVDRKGINELFHVFNELYKRNENSRLLLVGPFEMNQIEDKSLVESINKHPAIINYGKVNQEEVPALMLAMDVFVLPSWWEGFGNVLVQAAAMGIPVISTMGTGTIDAVNHGYNGILVPVKDKNKLKNAMVKLSEESETRIKFAENGLLWAQNFDRIMIWNEMHGIYQK
jgi:glycosyltransferase involved in cell wall biosynthesis